MNKERATDLVSQMTVEEMIGQLRFDAPSIPRLGIPAYNWWNEGLHGAARSGTAAVFPQAIGLAAAFDDSLIHEVDNAVATEQRGKYNTFSSMGDRGIYKGLTVWSPNINIFRDPRWGRGQETFGEDPFLSGTLGVAFIKGLQGGGPCLETASCVKHLAAHSGPEPPRHSFNALVSPRNLRETYLPAFEKCDREGKVSGVMGAYSALNGESCRGSPFLMKDILRDGWQFGGMYISDCWAVRDFHEGHGVTGNEEESAALALNSECDLNCGSMYRNLKGAFEEGLVSADRIKEACVRNMTTRFDLGLFDEECPYDGISFLDVDSEEHRALSLEASKKSLVLLKNDGFLPLSRERIGVMGIIGPNGSLEGEMRDDGSGGWAGDKESLRLPACQRRLLKAVCRRNTPVVVVLLSGGAIDPEIEPYGQVKALVQAWYPGEFGGRAIADLLLGSFSPSGRLPVTFYSREYRLPGFTDYAMEARTYRYLREEPLYPFGYGLSYSVFLYSGLSIRQREKGDVDILFRLKNAGAIDASEAVQVYCRTDHGDFPDNPVLCGISHVFLHSGEEREVSLTIGKDAFTCVDSAGRRNRRPGWWELFVGGRQPDALSEKLTGTGVLKAGFTYRHNKKRN